MISIIQPPSAKKEKLSCLGREVEFRFSQWRCAFVFHWTQKGEFELQGRRERGMGACLEEEEQLLGAEARGAGGCCSGALLIETERER